MTEGFHRLCICQMITAPLTCVIAIYTAIMVFFTHPIGSELFQINSSFSLWFVSGKIGYCSQWWMHGIHTVHNFVRTGHRY